MVNSLCLGIITEVCIENGFNVRILYLKMLWEEYGAIKKYIILCILMMSCSIVFCGAINGKCDNNVTKAELVVDSGLLNIVEQYQYTTVSQQEMIYLSHYFGCIERKPCDEVLLSNDGVKFHFLMYEADGTVKRYDFTYDYLWNDTDSYRVSSSDIRRFLDVVSAMKNNRLQLDDVSMTPSPWAQAEVNRAMEEKLVPEWNQIDYQGKITRVEVCQLLYAFMQRTEGWQSLDQKFREESIFSDTRDLAVNALAKEGIVSGKTTEEFCPYDLITREELAVVLGKVYAKKGAEIVEADSLPYRDAKNISSWATKDVQRLTSIGIFVGDDNQSFRPHDHITKEETIAVLLRLMDIYLTL